MSVAIEPKVIRRTTEVMSCDASIVIVGDRADDVTADLAIRRLHDLEHRWSRFLVDSEISRLNRSGGRPIEVSAETARLVASMVEAWHLTGGAYDPTLLRVVVESGYRTSRTDPRRSTELDPSIRRRGRPAAIRLDPSTNVVELPTGTAIDPGGIGKGLAADLVVEEIMQSGADGALVEIGGDLSVRGRPPEGNAWTIAVGESPDDQDPPVLVQLSDGGVATSTTVRRRWNDEGRERHHLIDPSTLDTSASTIRTCTVIAGTAALAEAFTKTAFGPRSSDALAGLDDHRLAGLLRLGDGRVRTSRAWTDFRGKAER